MWGMGRIKAAGLALLLTMGVLVGPAGGLVAEPEAPGAEARLAQLDPEPDRAAMFAAVKQMLEKAHVSPQDMPRRIIAVTAVGGGRYKVRMQMVQGDGWFELTWDGKAWQVKGLPGPGTSKR